MSNDLQLVTPFFDDSEEFCLGFEAGRMYKQLKQRQRFIQTIHTKNKAQIELQVIEAGAIYEFSNQNFGWTMLTVKGFINNN